jgi:hypothetical protein
LSYRTVKIKITSYQKLQELLERLAHDGWASVGADRRDAPTITNVVDEAISSLLARKRARRPA